LKAAQTPPRIQLQELLARTTPQFDSVLIDRNRQIEEWSFSAANKW